MGTEENPYKSEFHEYTLEDIIEGKVTLEDLTIGELYDIHLELVFEKNRIRDIILGPGKEKDSRRKVKGGLRNVGN